MGESQVFPMVLKVRRPRFNLCSAIALLTLTIPWAGYAQGVTQEIAEVRRILEQAIQIANTIPDTNQKAITLGNIARAQAAAGDTTAALQTVNTIGGAVWKTLALREIATIQLKAGNMKEALQTANSIGNPYIKFTFALEGIARGQANAGDRAGAVVTLQEAVQTANAIGDAHLKESALERTAIAQATAGDVKGALQTANSIGNIHLKTAALRAIASAQAGIGDVKGALAWALDQSLPFVKSYALLGVAEGVLRLKPRQLVSSPS